MSFFKKFLESKISKFFAGLIIIVFITLEFSSNYMQNKSDQWLFKVGDVEYNPKDWQKSYMALISDPLSSQEALSNPKLAKKKVLDEIVTNSLILQESARIGFSVSDRMVANEVVHLKTFRDKDGKFSKELLEKQLKDSGLSEAEFVKHMKDQLVRNHLMDIFHNTSGMVAKSTQDFIAKLLVSEQNLTVYSVAKVNEKIDYSDEDLKLYMERNKKLFTNPDTADISTVLFTSDIFKKDDLTPSTEEISSYYEANASLSPEKRTMQQIIISSHNEAMQTLQDIRSDKISYNNAAKKYVKDQVMPYEIGPITEDSFDPEIGKIVFGLEEGGISDLIETPLGWHIFRVKEIIPAKKEELSNVKDKIVDVLIKQKLQEKMHELVKDVTSDIEDGRSLDELASKYSLEVSRITESAKHVPEIEAESEYPGFSKAQLLRKIFTGEDKGIQIIPAQDNSSFMLLNVNTVTKGELMSFEEAIDDLKEGYIESELDKRTKEKILKIRGDLLENTAIDSDAGSFTTKKLRFSRLVKNEEIPSCIESEIVKLHQDRNFNGITLPCKENNSYHIAVLEDFDFSVNPTPEQMQMLAQTINSVYNQIVFSQFIDSLKQTYKVELDKKFEQYLNE